MEKYKLDVVNKTLTISKAFADALANPTENCPEYDLYTRLMQEIPGLTVHLYEIDNKFFGKNITVAGLVTGGDLIAQVKDKPLGETLCIPSVMLRHEGDLFLDNVSVEEVEEALGVSLTVVDTAYGADAFVDALLGM